MSPQLKTSASHASLAESAASGSGSASSSSAVRAPGSALSDPDDASIPSLDSFPPTGTPTHPKLSSWELYAALGSPRRIVAPMVDQSELAWRILSRRYGAELVYSPMINAGMFVTAVNASKKGKGKGKRFLDENFDVDSGEEGAELIQLLGKEHEGKKDTDAPLIVQFCANNPDTLLRAAQHVETRCSAIDLNLGCPQGIARKGHYGAFLMEDWPLVFRLINTLHLHSRAPVTAKMRIYPSLARTVAYARMLERAGAQFLTVHGRTREMKGHKTGLADWEAIRAVKRAVKIPVFANGNVQYPADVELALARTGADGIMSAEGNLFNPAIFLPASSPLVKQPSSMFPLAPEFPFPAVIPLATEYLDIVRGLRTQTGSSAIKAHLFKICKPALDVHKEFREVLGRSHLQFPLETTPEKIEDEEAELARRERRLVDYRNFVKRLAEKLDVDAQAGLDAFRKALKEREDAAEAATAPTPARKAIPPATSSPYYVQPDGLVVDGGAPAEIIEAGTAAEGGRSFDDDPQRPDRIPHWLVQPYFRPELPAIHFQKNAEQAALRAAAKASLAKAAAATTASSGAAAKREREGNDDDDDAAANGAAGTGKESTAEELAQPKRLRDMLAEASALKDEGNAHFVAKRTSEALACYDDALAALPPQPVQRSEEEEGEDEEKGEGKDEVVEEIASSGVKALEEAERAECAKLRATVYANQAACHLALEHYDQAIAACSAALVDDPSYVKALYRRASAYEKKGGWVALSNAEQDLNALLASPTTPSSLRPTVQASLARLRPLVESAAKKEQEEMMGQLKGLGNSVLGYFGLSTDNFKFEQQPSGGYSINFVK
ncbi:tRNA dihydrouridine synthase [Tilletia horrida]|nr:tRNA dihydrouridine synthase [Tilletia horrida]